MATFIRLTDYKSSDEKEQGFFKPENRYEAKQEDFEKIPGSPVAYWVGDRIKTIFDISEPLVNIFNPRQGMKTLDNDRFTKLWFEVSKNNSFYTATNLKIAKDSSKMWFPINHGGENKRWYGNNEYVVNWQNDGFEIKKLAKEKYNSITRTVTNIDSYFMPGVTWSVISSGNPSFRFFDEGFIFSNSGQSMVSDNQFLRTYIGAFLNTKITNILLNMLSPTLGFESGYLKKLPIIFPKQESTKQTIDTLTQQNIDISKEEWDSRETSWDFAQNEILRILNDEFLILNEKKPTLEVVYKRYCEYWSEKFHTLHGNEEELNRLFIDIYELQDELTPDVALKDITILKQEADIVEGKLVFNADEIMKQYISYAVGVMFGRYSLDFEGLQIANLGSDTLVSQMTDETKVSFPIDDDNVIPVLEDDYFKDDIASRFVQFVKTTFGEESLHVNIRFIENALGTTLRKYFVKGFYEDHIKRYKKRPIYWMVSSPKKGFNALIYMHRYQSDIFARVRNSYLTEYIAKLEAHKDTLHLTTTSETASDKDKKDADKQIKNIDAKLKELIEFNREKMMSFSQHGTDIDLDDGVKVNYCKFEDILYPITGLCK